MSLSSMFGSVQSKRFPRVSGDEPTGAREDAPLIPFSPRERG